MVSTCRCDVLSLVGGGKRVSLHRLWEVGGIEEGQRDSTYQMTRSIGAFGKNAHIACITSDQKARPI